MKTVLSSQSSHELRNNHIDNFIEEYCPFIQKCSQNVNPRILDLRCNQNYENCTIYPQYKVLERNPVRTGLQRFQLKYKDFDYGRQLGVGAT
mgnify:CR=1 FL=1